MSRSLRSSEAIVLKKINFGDADRIYTLLTREYGRVSAIAKGVRKISSRRSGSLDTLNHIKISLSESSSDIKTIREVDVISSFKEIKNSLDYSLTAYYFVEIVNKSVEEGHEAGEIFDLLLVYLDKLNKKEEKLPFLINKFEYLIMKSLGYEIGLEKLKSFGRDKLEAKLKEYVRDTLDENFKSLEI